MYYIQFYPVTDYLTMLYTIHTTGIHYDFDIINKIMPNHLSETRHSMKSESLIVSSYCGGYLKSLFWFYLHLGYTSQLIIWVIVPICSVFS